MKHLNKIIIGAVLALLATAAHAECYSAATGLNPSSPPCVSVQGYLDSNNNSHPVSATTQLPVMAPASSPVPVYTQNLKATYSYQINDYAPAATATDILCITGSATKTVKLQLVQITADATGAAVIDLYVYKRTAANTGGTATHPAATQADSADAAATAALNLYSANPTGLGTGTLLAGDHYELPATTGTAYFSAPWVEKFGSLGEKPVTLHGTAEQVCVSANGQTLPSGYTEYIRLLWTEE